MPLCSLRPLRAGPVISSNCLPANALCSGWPCAASDGPVTVAQKADLENSLVLSPSRRISIYSHRHDRLVLVKKGHYCRHKTETCHSRTALWLSGKFIPSAGIQAQPSNTAENHRSHCLAWLASRAESTASRFCRGFLCTFLVYNSASTNDPLVELISERHTCECALWNSAILQQL